MVASVLCGSCEWFYLIDILYGVVGGCQGVYMWLLVCCAWLSEFLSDLYTVWECGWLPGSCYVIASLLCVVARVFVSD